MDLVLSRSQRVFWALIIFPSSLSEKKVKKSDCGEWQWSVCVPTSGDCGLGTREGTRTGAECKQTMKTQRCKIPCNWKKQFGGESHPYCPIDLIFHPEIILASFHQVSF